MLFASTVKRLLERLLDNKTSFSEHNTAVIMEFHLGTQISKVFLFYKMGFIKKCLPYILNHYQGLNGIDRHSISFGITV